MPARLGAGKCERSVGTLAIQVSAGSTVTRASAVVGMVTEVQGQLVQSDEHPHGAPSGQPSSGESLHSAAVSAFATVSTPLIVTSKAAIKRAWSRRGT